MQPHSLVKNRVKSVSRSKKSDMTEHAVRKRKLRKIKVEKHVGCNTVWASCDNPLNTAVQTHNTSRHSKLLVMMV